MVTVEQIILKCMNLFGLVVVAAIILRHTVFPIVALLLSFWLLSRYLPLLLADFLGYGGWTLTLFTALCSSLVNKGFLLFLISSALPPSTFCLWKPWFVVRSLQLEPGWPAPLSCLKGGCRWKIYDCMPWKPHIPFEVLLFLWCSPHWWQLCLPSLFDRRFSSQWECKSGREGGTVSMALHHFTIIH